MYMFLIFSKTEDKNMRELSWINMCNDSEEFTYKFKTAVVGEDESISEIYAHKPYEECKSFVDFLSYNKKKFFEEEEFIVYSDEAYNQFMQELNFVLAYNKNNEIKEVVYHILSGLKYINDLFAFRIKISKVVEEVLSFRLHKLNDLLNKPNSNERGHIDDSVILKKVYNKINELNYDQDEINNFLLNSNDIDVTRKINSFVMNLINTREYAGRVFYYRDLLSKLDDYIDSAEYNFFKKLLVDKKLNFMCIRLKPYFKKPLRHYIMTDSFIEEPEFSIDSSKLDSAFGSISVLNSYIGEKVCEKTDIL